MKQKCKLLAIALLSALILIFSGANIDAVYAATVLTDPLSFAFADNYTLDYEVYFSDNAGAYLLLDDDSYITSPDVTSVVFTMTDPDGLDVENEDDLGGYYFVYDKVGTYVLTATITDGVNETTQTFDIKVGKSLSSSQLGTRYDMDVISDSGLYQRLQTAFETLYKEQFAANCNVSGVYSDMFTIVDIDILDLSGAGINSLNGINKLNFGTIRGIDLSNNSLVKVTNEQFTVGYNQLEYLNLSNNKITDVAIDNLTKLTELNLSNNKITTLDLSKLNIGTSALALNLAYNNIATTDDITIPKAENKFASMHINLMSNYIGEPTKDYKENSKLSFTLGFQFQATPVQDPNTDDRVIMEHSDTIYYYKTNIPGLKLKLYSITKDEDDANIETEYQTIDESQMTGDVVSFKLACGEYLYKYFLGDEEAYKAENGRRHYRSEVFHCLPDSPEYYFEYNGKTYTSISKVTGYVTVHFKEYVSDENITIYYKVNGDDWQTGATSVTVSSGKDTVYIKAVSDNGYESYVTAVDVHTSLNPYVPDFIMLLLVIFCMIMIIFVLIPLLGKWVNSDSKR